MTTDIHRGSCHCGKVTFEFHARLDYAVECNCSLCRRKGALWHGVPEPNLRILSGEEDLVLYQFLTKTAKHYSCRHCGVAPFSRPRLDPRMWVVNVRCVDGVDLSALPLRKFDGEHWEEAARALLASRAPAPAA